MTNLPASSAATEARASRASTHTTVSSDISKRIHAQLTSCFCGPLCGKVAVPVLTEPGGLHHRLLEPLGYIPPAEAEPNCYRNLTSQDALAA